MPETPENTRNGDAQPVRREAESPALARRAARVLLTICLAELGVIVLLWFGNHMVTASLTQLPPPRTAQTAGGTEPYYRGRPGPWGELEFIRIAVEPPDAFVQVDDRVFERTRWHFVNHTRDSLTALVNSWELAPEQKAELLTGVGWQMASNAVSVVPSEQLILGLPPRARAQIYS